MGLVYFLLGIGVLLLSLYGMRAFVNADPRRMSGTVRKIGGGVALVVALLMAMRGALIFAVPLAAVGMALLGWSLPGGFGPVGGGSKTSGQRSRVRTAMLDMQLDHDTGRMDGDVTAGQFAGKRLSALGRAELMALWNECRQRDGQSARLLEAYLDHLSPDWREAAGAGPAGSETGGPARGNGRMSAEEAYEVLGLRPGASAGDVRRAHRDLMKKMHPDRGGSTYIAAKINEAKDVLLRAKR